MCPHTHRPLANVTGTEVKRVSDSCLRKQQFHSRGQQEPGKGSDQGGFLAPAGSLFEQSCAQSRKEPGERGRALSRESAPLRSRSPWSTSSRQSLSLLIPEPSARSEGPGDMNGLQRQVLFEWRSRRRFQLRLLIYLLDFPKLCPQAL